MKNQKNKSKQGAKKYFAITGETYNKIIEKRKVRNKNIQYPEKKSLID
jgi:hypothetical protein